MIDYTFVGWKCEGVSDKVWISMVLSRDPLPSEWWQYQTLTWAQVWGRRGKALQFKVFKGTVAQQSKTIQQKIRDGYQKVTNDRLTEIYPEYEQDLEKTALWAMLSS